MGEAKAQSWLAERKDPSDAMRKNAKSDLS